MVDVFLSYSSKHRDLTRQLAEVIASEGYSVWWDHDLESWGSYQKQIRAALDEARVVVVIWTEGARDSDYVYAEARRAYDDGKLVNACAPDFPMHEIPEPMSVSHIDYVTDHAGILATIASVWAGTPTKTRVPYHELFFGRLGRRLLDGKIVQLNRHLEEVSPSELLQARYQVVPFIDISGRRQEFLNWCRRGRSTAGRVIHGPGGLGKTRLMIDVAIALRADGWLAGFLEPGHEPTDTIKLLRSNALEQLVSTGDEPGVFIVMDYAEGRQNEIDWLVKRLDARPRNTDRRVRLVLLARSAGTWWQELHDKRDEIPRVFRLPVDTSADIEATKRARKAARFGDVIGLDRIPVGDSRVEFFRASVVAFEPVVRAMGWPVRTSAPPDERRLLHYRNEPTFGRPLALQMEALLYLAMAELDPDLIGVDAILDRMLALERRHWAKLIGELDAKREYDLRRGVAQVAAVGGVGTRHAITELLMRDRYYRREVPEHARPVLLDLARVYGTDMGGIAPLEPDLLGEHEVAITADTRLVNACLDWIATLPSPEQSDRRKQLVTVLQRATLQEHGPDRASNAAALLDHLIYKRSGEIAWELLAVRIDTPGKLGELLDASLDHFDDETLERFDNSLPPESLALMDFSLALADRRLQLTRESTPAAKVVAELDEHARIDVLDRLAVRLGQLGMRLSHSGRQDEAIKLTQEAVDIYRRLSETNPNAVLTNLASSLNNMSVDLSDLGRRDEALAAAKEAVEIRRRLAEIKPSTFQHALANSLMNLCMTLSDLGRHDEALVASQEAVGIYRSLAKTTPELFIHDLGKSLSSLAISFSNLARHGEALVASGEALDIYRPLAQTRPDAFLPFLARILSHAGTILSNLRRPEEALAALQESIAIRKSLAESRPGTFLSDLATDLSTLGNRFARLGRYEEALPPLQEATDIKRILAESRPGTFLPDLASTLTDLSSNLAKLGRRKEALTASQEATDILRRLADTQTHSRPHDLARTLLHTARDSFNLGHHEDALAASQEAVVIYRRLAETLTGVSLPELAMSLTNVSQHLSSLGRHEEALAASQEAASIYRSRAETHPDDFARAMSGLGVMLYNIGHREEALVASQEAVNIFRRLAETRPEVLLPDLARSILNNTRDLQGVGRDEEALIASQEAVDIFRQLAETRPDAFLPELAGSLSNTASLLATFGREEGLTPSQEAVGIYRRLAETQPDTFRSHLAMSLFKHAGVLSSMGRGEAAVAVSKESIEIYRGLAAGRPEAFLPTLAASLNNINIYLCNLNRLNDALVASQEVIEIYRHLEERHPGSFLSELAESLTNISIDLHNLEHREAAVAATQEAVDIFRRLADEQPGPFLPNLAMTLNNLGTLLASLGRNEQAVAASEESVHIRRRLAGTQPDVFLPKLASSLSTLGELLATAERYWEAAAAAREGLSVIAPFTEANALEFGDLARELSRHYVAACEKAGADQEVGLLERVGRALAADVRSFE